MNPESPLVSTAKQTIYRLASFPESETDLRITKTLDTCHAQSSAQKFLSWLTCGCLFSRRAYDENTNLTAVFARLRDTIRVLSGLPEFKQNIGGLRSSCEKAIRVFNAVVGRCSSNRIANREEPLGYLRINLDTLLQDLEREAHTLSLVEDYPSNQDGTIDYESLFKKDGSPLSSPPTPSAKPHIP